MSNESNADRVAALEQQVAELRGLLTQATAAQVSAALVPHGYRIVPDGQVQDERSLKEQELLRKEIEKGAAVRTQEVADRTFPAGSQVFDCVLEDGNGHPRVRIKADYPTDASARYLVVCNVNHAEKAVTVTPVAQAA